MRTGDVAMSVERLILSETFTLLTRPGVWVCHAPTCPDEQCLQTAIGFIANHALTRPRGSSYQRCVLAVLRAIDRLYPQHGCYGIPPFNDSHTLKDIQRVLLEAMNIVDGLTALPPMTARLVHDEHLVYLGSTKAALKAAGDGIVIAAIPLTGEAAIDNHIWEMPGYIVAKPRSYYTTRLPMMAQAISGLGMA